LRIAGNHINDGGTLFSAEQAFRIRKIGTVSTTLCIETAYYGIAVVCATVLGNMTGSFMLLDRTAALAHLEAIPEII
jgi:hypothetical protein